VALIFLYSEIGVLLLWLAKKSGQISICRFVNRAAVVLGFVGVGGFGQQLFIALNLFLHQQLLTLITAIFFLLTVVDLCSAWLRRVLV
jgi:ABC-type phosphate/phosphonate transport system permease subunit